MCLKSLLNTVKTFLDKDGRKTPFQDNKPGNKWFRSLVKRNPRVKLADKPSQIWKSDQTGFDMQALAGNVVGPTERKEVPFCVLPGS